MRQNADASATYKKLDDDTWGVWLHDLEGRPGMRVTVTTSNGRTKLERLTEQVWADENRGLELWRIEEE